MLDFLKKIYIIANYIRTYRLVNIKLKVKEIEKNSICLMLYRFESRSGGIRNISRIVNELSKYLKKDVLIYVQNKSRHDNYLLEEYGFKGNVIDYIPLCEFYVTGSWIYSQFMNDFKYSYTHKYKWIHIIQDYDELFFPVSDKYFYATNIKKGPDCFISSGKWMLSKSKNIYLPFPVDSNIYFSKKNTLKPIDVLIFHKPELPRRCAVLCEQIAEQLLQLSPNLNIAFYGSSLSKLIAKVNVVHYGAVPSLQQLSDLYRNSKIGISINFTNPSLIPFEQMACGCMPLSPKLDGFDEFELKGIHFSGTIKQFCDHVLELLNGSSLEERTFDLMKEYKEKEFICDYKEFESFISDKISQL